MASNVTKQYGVTPPISTEPPTKRELEVSKKLILQLTEAGQYESEADAQKREDVLGRLDKLVKEFVLKVSLKKNLPESIAEQAGGKIFTFGSYRLGVHGKGADIDTLCVVPKHVVREDFFNEMFESLKLIPEITELTSVPDAYVPVIKFEFSGIPIDLVFARLGLPSVPDDLELSDDNLLKNLDDRCVRSLNGSRVTDDILRLVPNIDNFRTALRCIKMWAKKRAIYSNVMGFFGGVAWAMVVARVCQLYPNAASATLVSKFFRIMGAWNWPQPILLKNIEDGPLQVRVWNPKLYPQDRQHRMPLITPAYPSMCATHNVTSSTQTVMTKEFARAADITDRILISKTPWSTLFEEHNFFGMYKFYLQVVVSCGDKEGFLKWSGMVESKIRSQLVLKLEAVENLVLAHPFIKGIETIHKCSSEAMKQDVVNGRAPAVEASAADEDESTVYTSNFYIGLEIAKPSVGKKSKVDISFPVTEFKSLICSWDHFVESNMGVQVNYLKRDALPDSVFGEKGRPAVSKKRKSNQTDKASKKTKLSDSITTPITDHVETPMAETDELIPEQEEKKVEEKTTFLRKASVIPRKTMMGMKKSE